MQYADIIIDISHERLDRSFQYRIPEELCPSIRIGSVVAVPFGNGARNRQGFVVGLSDEPKLPEEKIRDIVSVNEKKVPVESQLIELAGWMRQHYGGTLTQSLSTVLPVKKKVQRRKIQPREPEAERAEAEKLPRKSDGTNGSLASDDAVPPLNTAQQNAADTFQKDYENGVRKTYLLFGVTGSGKTRVYLEMIGAVLAAGRSVIVLIPEIALTRQNIERFSERFGDRVAVLHSRLSDGERYEVYERAKRGDIRIVLGPRSALFVPFSSIGLIVVDEEHETSYKSEQVPKYHAREVALQRAKMADASVVLGSATPSVDSLLRVKNGEYQMLSLPQRVKERPLPKTTIVDMREELKAGNRSMISSLLREKIAGRLERQEQVLLFLNRRGMAGFVSCRSCGQVIKCPHCDVSLHQHRDGILRCHYCGHNEPQPKTCRSCGSKYIGGFRAGTQSIENLLQKLYPKARILRMDADSTKHKGDHDRILSQFAAHKADILLGTQMIVKGHDFSDVTLVGVLAADLSLHGGDYTGGERTFDLLVQAGGRAGRGERQGEVIVQTYQPDHYAITAAAKADVNGFAERELAYRSLLRYPPVAHILLVQIFSGDPEEGQAAAQEIHAVVAAEKGKKLSVAKPTAGMIAKMKDRYRFAVYIKAAEYDALVGVKDVIEAHTKEEPFAGRFSRTRVFFDFDPLGMF
ncbi:MAG: primosomal protein N' [Lachnospiraceae bacterium]|nr:primosomal protein N' [Lachnospiraceae bacterium]